MLKKYSLFLILSVFYCNVFCKQKPIDWQKPLPISPKIKTGVLKNGIAYYLYPAATQKDKVSFRLLVNAGSVMETEEESGIAHYIEHMTFNGSENFKPGTLIHFFQDNGIKFGNDTNAFTSYFHTCYQIDLPRNDKDNIQKGLLVLRDQGLGCLFLPEEINRERGVILSEMRTRDSAGYRAFKAMLNFMFPDSPIAKRFPIGTEQAINRFSQSNFVNFYKRWYTPQRMSIVVTGDFKEKEMISLLRDAFDTKNNSLNNKDKTETPDLGPIPFPKEKLEVSVYQNDELPATSLTLQANRKINERTQNLETLKEDFAWMIMANVIKHRLNELKLRTDIKTAEFGRSVNFQILENGAFEIIGDAKNILSTIQNIEKFKRSIEDFGFSFQEIETGKKALEGALQITHNKEDNATPPELADGIVKNLMEGCLLASAKQDRENFSLISRYITAEYCFQLWKNLWRNGAYLFISTPSKDIQENIIKQAFLDSQKTTLPLPKKTENLTFQDPFIKRNSVKIIRQFKDKVLDVESLVFDNNVRINLKKTTFEKDKILVNVSVGTGLLDLKDTPYPGINLLLGSSFVAGGLKQCSYNDLKRIFDGKPINLDFDVDEDSYTFKAITNQACFKEQMQLIGAYLTEPGYREEGLQDFKKIVPVWYDYFEHNPEGILQSHALNFLVCNDPRWGYPEQSLLLSRNFDEAKKVLAPILDKACMEITIVGDFDRRIIIKQLQETVGQLAKREPNNVVETQEVPFPTPQTKVFACKTELDKSIIHIVWPTESLVDIQNARIFNVLRDVLGNKLLQEIRQTMGDTYSPKVSNYQSETFNLRGYISASLVVSTEKVNVVTEKIYSVVEDVMKKGITQEDLDRSLKPIMSSLEKQRETNSFWLNWVRNIQQHPEKNKWALDDLSLYKKISVEDVNRVAQKYLTRTASICIQIKPEGK